MTAPAKLAAFAVAVAVAFGLGFGFGEIAGPLDDAPDTPAHDVHDMEDQ